MKREEARDADNIYSQQITEVKQRLLAEGFDSSDIQRALMGRSITVQPLSDSVWKQIHPRLVRDVQTERAQRLEQEYKQLVKEREKLLEQPYTAFLCTKKPSEALFYPHADAFCDLPGFKEVLYRTRETNVTPADFIPAIEDGSLAQYATDWLQKDPRIEKLASIVSSRQETPFPSCFYHSSGQDANEPDLGTTAVDLDLNAARTVFRCRKVWFCEIKSTYCGLDEALVHSQHSRLSYADTMRHMDHMWLDVRSSRIVDDLLRLLGLPSSTTGADLDARDGWFLCETCLPEWYINNQWCKRVMTWRQCVRMPSYSVLSQGIAEHSSFA
ncbi:hypothetical protein EIP86_009043 [Pleurotus ostreatoroseus]|nr:hypothetical protein EIP86_009043 [Pleurotus ostreatoroseus]